MVCAVETVESNKDLILRKLVNLEVKLIAKMD